MVSPFRARAEGALGRARQRGNIRRAMDGLVQKRLAAFPDNDELERLRDQAQLIRDHALACLPELLGQLEASCTGSGIQVHWAEDAAEANRIILGLCRRHGAQAILKGKSMVSEEIGLNAALAAAGIEAIETDLGELIIQLAREHPSHIVAPAVHKDRAEIAALFRRHFPDQMADADDADIDTLTALARRIMRERFRTTRVGLSGVNFAVAETGTLCLVENEGNGRMSTTAPDVHIAVTGIEKVVARVEHLAPLLSLLTRSATGQPITTYVNLISGPRRGDERDGPREVHLVLLDNGRSRIHADPELRETLRCIRCGACMNHCPVYARIGGHGYGTVYPGPIGAILEPQLQGAAHQGEMVDASTTGARASPRLQGLALHGELAEASTLCGACAEVCPVRIPIPRLLNRLRYERAVDASESGDKRPARQRHLWRGWAAVHASPWRYRWLTRMATRVARPLIRGPLAAALGPWTRSRAAPRIAAHSLHELARQDGFSDD